MSSIMPLEPISAVFERNLTIRAVYGEPVRQGDTTVIPVAKVAFGFGAGGGRGPARERFTTTAASKAESVPDAQDGGGAGNLRLGNRGGLAIVAASVTEP